MEMLALLLGDEGAVITLFSRSPCCGHCPLTEIPLLSSGSKRAGLWAFGGHPNSLFSLLLPLLQVMCSVCYIASPSSMTVRLTTWAVAERKPS